MAALTSQTIDGDGLVNPTYAAATATTGDTCPCDGRTMLHVKNGGGSSTVVTISSYYPDRVGAAHADQPITVAAAGNALIALDPTFMANPADGTAKVVCSVVTSVTLAALRLP